MAADAFGRKFPGSNLFFLQVGLSFIHASEFGTHCGLLMASATLGAVPLSIFFAFQKHIMQGPGIGTLKG